MGGHGGLNILPQKRWNVYNFDNREKVKKDEEAAAKDEQLKREQARKRDAEYRLEQLRTACGLAPTIQASAPSAPPGSESASAPPDSESRHINLFEGIKVFDMIDGGGEGKRGVEKDGPKKKKKMKKEEPAPRVVTEEDEKYRLGYGVAGKGVKLPWYLARPSDGKNDGSARDNDTSRSGKKGSKSCGKKTIEELREERLRREKREKERTRALIHDKGQRDVPIAEDRYFSRNRRFIR